MHSALRLRFGAEMTTKERYYDNNRDRDRDDDDDDDNDGDNAAVAVVDVREDDWNLPMEFHLFATHERRKVYYYDYDYDYRDYYSSRRRRRSDDKDHSYFEVECVERLTPIDATNLGSGRHDATGHCVWTGAFLLVASLPLPFASWTSKTTMSSSSSTSSSSTTTATTSSTTFAGRYFGNRRRILELGCGTGIGGIALLRYYAYGGGGGGDEEQQRRQQQQQQHERTGPSLVCLTDADPDALALCRRNCRLNGFVPVSSSTTMQRETTTTTTSADDVNTTTTTSNNQNDYGELFSRRCQVKQLAWSCNPEEDVLPRLLDDDDHVNNSDDDDENLLFDTVLATDVLYDIGLLPELFTTAYACLGKGGSGNVDGSGGVIDDDGGGDSRPRYFVLSHVPRACYGTDHHPPAGDLEAHIAERARRYGFALEETIRPSQLLSLRSEKKGTRRNRTTESSTSSSSTLLFPPDALNSVASLEDMDQVGAAVLVFRKGVGLEALEDV